MQRRRLSYALVATTAALSLTSAALALADKPDWAGAAGTGNPNANANNGNGNNGNGNGPGSNSAGGNGNGNGNATPPGQTVRDDATAGAPGQEKKGDGWVPPGQVKDPTLPADWLAAPLKPSDVGPAQFVNPADTTLGKTVGVVPTGGTVRVKKPGSDEWVALAAGAPLPVGVVIDATEGAVELGAEALNGVEQHAMIGGAQFVVNQKAADEGITDLSLQGGDFDPCAKTPLRARAASKSRSRSKSKSRSKTRSRRRSAMRRDGVVRGLWGSGKGRFRTHGRNATASVRGTHWILVDRCKSTTVRVVEGIVDVTDDATGKRVAVRAGERRVVRAGQSKSSERRALRGKRSHSQRKHRKHR